MWKLYFLIIILLFAFFLMNLPNVDEGWYTNAAKMIYKQGKMPYRDFVFNQAPLQPYIYGFFLNFIGYRIYSARALSLVLNLLTLYLFSKSLNSIGGFYCKIIGLSMLFFDPFFLIFTAFAKTHALTSCLFSVFLFLFIKYKDSPAKWVGGAILLSIISGTRIDAIAGFLPFFLYMFFCERKNTKIIIITIITSIIILSAIFFPFIINYREQFYFNVFRANLNWISPGIDYNFAIKNTKKFTLTKMSYVFQIIRQHQFLFSVLFAIFLFFILIEIPKIIKTRFKYLNNYSEKYIFFIFLILMFLSMNIAFIIHPSPQGDYPTKTLPLLVIIASFFSSKIINSEKEKRFKTYKLTLFLSFSILNLIIGFPWGFNNYIPYNGVFEVAKFIKEHTNPSLPIYSCHLYDAVESNRNVLKGTENGLWSYFPHYNTKKCEKFKTVNDEIILSYIKNQKPSAIILAGYNCPLLLKEKFIEAIHGNYYLAKEVENFGQLQEKAQIFLPKK